LFKLFWLVLISLLEGEHTDLPLAAEASDNASGPPDDERASLREKLPKKWQDSARRHLRKLNPATCRE